MKLTKTEDFPLERIPWGVPIQDNLVRYKNEDLGEDILFGAVKVTFEIADYWLDNYFMPPYQRKEIPVNRDQIGQAMIKDKWIFAGDDIEFAWHPDLGILLINGQHRLKGLIRAIQMNKGKIAKQGYCWFFVKINYKPQVYYVKDGGRNRSATTLIGGDNSGIVAAAAGVIYDYNRNYYHPDLWPEGVSLIRSKAYDIYFEYEERKAHYDKWGERIRKIHDNKLVTRDMRQRHKSGHLMAICMIYESAGWPIKDLLKIAYRIQVGEYESHRSIIFKYREQIGKKEKEREEFLRPSENDLAHSGL